MESARFRKAAGIKPGPLNSLPFKQQIPIPLHMSTSKLLPAVIEQSVKPKPTKTEVITALAMLHIEQCQKLRTDNAAKVATLSGRIEVLMLRAIRKSGMSKFPVAANTGWWNDRDKLLSGVELKLSFPNINTDHPEICAALAEYHEADKHVSIPSLSDAKRLISRKMEGYQDASTRVAALISSPESREALEKMLKEIA